VLGALGGSSPSLLRHFCLGGDPQTPDVGAPPPRPLPAQLFAFRPVCAGLLPLATFSACLSECGRRFPTAGGLRLPAPSRLSFQGSVLFVRGCCLRRLFPLALRCAGRRSPIAVGLRPYVPSRLSFRGSVLPVRGCCPRRPFRRFFSTPTEARTPVGLRPYISSRGLLRFL
jgi:hypothetical protein